VGFSGVNPAGFATGFKARNQQQSERRKNYKNQIKERKPFCPYLYGKKELAVY